MELSQAERLILYNQYEILKAMCKDKRDIEHYDAIQTTLEFGYSRNYYVFSEHITETEFEPDKMKFVYDVLDMYRLLGDSYNKLPKPEKETIDSRSVLFPGFDGNDECEYLSYASYLTNELNLYSESKRPDLNTHAPYLWNYKKMLSKLNKIKGSDHYRLLSSDEITQIIE